MSLTSYRTAPPRVMARLENRDERLSSVSVQTAAGTVPAAVPFDDLAATYSPTP